MSASHDLLEAVQILHSIATPATEISRRLRVDQGTVRFVIRTGQLPARTLPMLWTDPPAVGREHPTR